MPRRLLAPTEEQLPELLIQQRKDIEYVFGFEPAAEEGGENQKDDEKP